MIDIGNSSADNKLYEIVRVDLKEMCAVKENERERVFSLTKKEVSKAKILTKENEVIRIVSAFNPLNKEVDKEDSSKYPYVRDLVVLKIGKSYKQYYNALCEGRDEEDKGSFKIKTVNITVNDNGDSTITEIGATKYKRLLCGSSSVRNAKELYIREELYDKTMEVLLTGIKKDALFPEDKFAKYSTYLGLAGSDSIPVSMPNICVVKDYKKMITDIFHIVKEVSKGKFDVEFAKCDEEEINAFDGAGLVSYEKAKQWAEELGLNYVPSSFQFRLLNGGKGNVYTFPLTEFIQEYKDKYPELKQIFVTDAWLNNVDIESPNYKIDVFLTESQFKFKNMYSSFDEWRDAFETDVDYASVDALKYSYHRTFNINNYSKSVDELSDWVVTAYQCLQTLQFEAEETPLLCEETFRRLKAAHEDIDEFMKYRGIVMDSESAEANIDNEVRTQFDGVPPYYKALALDDTLRYDPYIRKKIKDDLKSFIHRCYCGKLFQKGNYQTAIPDLLGLAQHIFGMEVVGTLKAGQIYSNYWNTKRVTNVSIWRNPHIACEWFNAEIVNNDDTEKWFKYQDTGIVTDIYSSLALRLGTMDFDGDTVATVDSNVIYNAVERANPHTIKYIPLLCDSKKEIKQLPISDTEKIMLTNKLGFQNNIGEVTNKVTVLLSLNQTDTIKKYVMIMSVVNQLIIDFVKTGIKVPIPIDIANEVKKHKKPSFLQFKDHNWIHDSNVDALGECFDLSEEEIKKQKKYELTNGTVDKVYLYLKQLVCDIEAKFWDDVTNGYERCQFYKLLQGNQYVYNTTYPKVKEKMAELQKQHEIICNKKYNDEHTYGSMDDSGYRFLRFYSFCELELLKVCKDRAKLLNYMIYIYWFDDEFVKLDKSILWNVFGKDIIKLYLHKEICTDEKILKTLDKKHARVLRKVTSGLDNASIVEIKDMSNDAVFITDAEVHEIKSSLPNDYVSQRLLFVLLVLYKKIQIDTTSKRERKLPITRSKKRMVTFNKLSKLSDIYYHQVEPRLKKLKNQELIAVDMKNIEKPKITPLIGYDLAAKEGCRIADINECQAHARAIFQTSNVFE
ncbi:MAG: hypothetical protein PHW34_14090 [Hespellia sp.]|nr:hypothetical protein [Hespellia sp.]